MKLVVLGSGGVGKSCSTLRYLLNKFVDHYDPTIEESYKKTVDVDGKKVTLEVVDTAGQEEFSGFRDATASFGEGFLIVFSVTRPESFDEAKNLLKFVKRIEEERKVSAVIVGNKIDLKEDRKVARSDAEEFCEQEGVPYFETSAKMSINVHEAFEELIRLVLKQKTGGAGASGGCGCSIL